MPINILSLFQPVKPNAAPTDQDVNPELNWQDGFVTLAAATLGVLIVAVFAVLMGLN